MKKLTAILIFAILTNCKENESLVKSSISEMELLGKVKTVIDIHLELQRDEHTTSIAKIDSIGYTIKTFNKEGFIIDEKIKIKGLLESQRIYVYNADKRLIEKNYITGGVHYKKDKFFYNKKGFLINENDSLNLGVVNIDYKYDKKGNIIEKSTNSSTGVKTLELYSYDKKDRILQREYIRDENNLVSSEYYEYEDDSSKVVKSNFGMDGKKSKSVSYLDSSKRIIKSKAYENETLFRFSEYFYYKDGKDSLSYHTDLNKNKKYCLKTTYQLDNNGNWIKQESYKNDTLINLKKRMITYYE